MVPEELQSCGAHEGLSNAVNSGSVGPAVL